MNIRRGGLLLAALELLLITTWSTTNAAASFDCEKAVATLERTICSDRALSSADEEMAKLFTRLKKTADPARSNTLLREQRSWLQQRTDRCSEMDAACLTKVYNERTGSLRAIVDKPVTPPVQQAVRKCYETGRAVVEDFKYLKNDLANTGIDLCTNALKLDPRNADAHFYRGAAYQAAYADDRAIEDYTAAITLDPKSAKAYLGRGNIYAGMSISVGAPEDSSNKAEADLTRAIELEPKNADAYSARADFNVNFNRGLALEDYSKAIELEPANHLRYYKRAEFYKTAKDFKSEIADLTRTLELSPNVFIAYQERGEAYLGLKEYSRAIEDLSKALELSPTALGAYYSRGLAYDAIGNGARAVADWRKSASLGSHLAKEILRQRGIRADAD